MRQCVSNVAVEDIHGTQRNCEGDSDEKLDNDDERKGENPQGEMVRIDQVERKERDESYTKLKDALNDIGSWESDLRKGDLPQHLVALPNRL